MGKTIPSFLFFLTISASLLAQKQYSAAAGKFADEFTYGDFKAGYGIMQFSSGLNQGFDIGNFSTSGGDMFSVAAYRKYSTINNLHFGLKFKGLGAASSRRDNNDEMFFNCWRAAFSTKYFPFSKSTSQGLYLQGDYNFASQFIQKYRNSDALEFDHQFAIGSSFTIGPGYQYPHKNRYAPAASIELDKASQQCEVNDVGNVQFQNENIGFQLGNIF